MQDRTGRVAGRGGAVRRRTDQSLYPLNLKFELHTVRHNMAGSLSMNPIKEQASKHVSSDTKGQIHAPAYELPTLAQGHASTARRILRMMAPGLEPTSGDWVARYQREARRSTGLWYRGEPDFMACWNTLCNCTE